MECPNRDSCTNFCVCDHIICCVSHSTGSFSVCLFLSGRSRRALRLRTVGCWRSLQGGSVSLLQWSIRLVILATLVFRPAPHITAFISLNRHSEQHILIPVSLWTGSHTMGTGRARSPEVELLEVCASTWQYMRLFWIIMWFQIMPTEGFTSQLNYETTKIFWSMELKSIRRSSEGLVMCVTWHQMRPPSPNCCSLHPHKTGGYVFIANCPIE